MAEYPVPEGGFAVTRKDAIARGHKVYLTGKECPNGHNTLRQVSDWKCVDCRREIRAKYRASNGEKINAWKRDWYASHPEKRASQIEYNKKWSEDKKDHLKSYFAGRYQKDKDKLKQQAKERMRSPARRAKQAERLRQKKLENPERFRTYARNRAAKKKGADGHHNGSDVDDILRRQGGLCVYCGSDISGKYHVDHMTPLSRGGSNWPSNLQCLCPTCNLQKWAKTDDDYRKEIGQP